MKPVASFAPPLSFATRKICHSFPFADRFCHTICSAMSSPSIKRAIGFKALAKKEHLRRLIGYALVFYHTGAQGM